MCKNELTTPQFAIDNKTDDIILAPLNLFSKQGMSGNVCCKNSSQYMQFYGEGCSKVIKSDYLNCNFTTNFALHPCSDEGTQKISQFCFLKEYICGISSYFLSGCGRHQLLSVCDTVNFYCSDLI